MSKFHRAVLFCTGIADFFLAYFLFPSAHVFAANLAASLLPLIPAAILGISGLLLVAASLSLRIAGLLRLSLFVLLGLQLVTFGPLLLYGVLLAGGMAGDSGQISVSGVLFALGFVIGIPLLFLGVVILCLVSIYKVGREVPVSLSKSFAVLGGVVLCTGAIIAGSVFALQQWTHLEATIDQSSLMVSTAEPVLSGTLSGHGEICIYIVPQDFSIGSKLMLYGGDKNLIHGACTTSHNVSVSNGHWSAIVKGYYGNKTPTLRGTYSVVVTNHSTSDVLATGQMVVSQ